MGTSLRPERDRRNSPILPVNRPNQHAGRLDGSNPTHPKPASHQVFYEVYKPDHHRRLRPRPAPVAARSIDFVLTDPPYLVDYHSRDGRSIHDDSDGAWLKLVPAELYRVLKPTDCSSASTAGMRRIHF